VTNTGKHVRSFANSLTVSPPDGYDDLMCIASSADHLPAVSL